MQGDKTQTQLISSLQSATNTLFWLNLSLTAVSLNLCMRTHATHTDTQCTSEQPVRRICCCCYTSLQPPIKDMGAEGTVSQEGVPGVNRRQAVVSLSHDQGTMTRAWPFRPTITHMPATMTLTGRGARLRKEVNWTELHTCIYASGLKHPCHPRETPEQEVLLLLHLLNIYNQIDTPTSWRPRKKKERKKTKQNSANKF